MNHQELRNKFITYFVKQGHTHVPAASLVPDNDPSVLFTVAGMQPFKECYAHPETAPASRIVTIQPCIRTNDIDEVGDDTHHTLFEMLGNFSFGYTSKSTDTNGPYFKEQAIRFAWEFLTQELGVATDRIRATYFGGDAQRPSDNEGQEILATLKGLSRIEAYGDDNFWGPVGDSGPCGPTVEFYIDDVEVWNVVFNQYHRDTDGNYTVSENQGVDTGMGFERFAAVLQGVSSNYETDLYKPFIGFVRSNAYTYDERQGRVIADHVKAALFLLAQGVKPGNKGRDYILRRLIRRAVRAGQLTTFSKFVELMQMYIKEFSPFYDYLTEHGDMAIALFEAEREKFQKNLVSGVQQLKRIIGNETGGEITGEQAFKLFDTYGFPIELTQELANESHWTVDTTGFQEQFAKHQQQSKAGLEKIFKGGLADHEPATVAHHTAHHLLLAALRQVLGDHVVQRGSNVTSERLRIDISHPEKITDDQLELVTSIVNRKIEEDLPVVSEIMQRDAALKLGALAEFGAKYPEEVCVYTVIDQDGEAFSREFCGGPHIATTGELGKFEILKEEASGAGLRRIRARVLPKE